MSAFPQDGVRPAAAVFAPEPASVVAPEVTGADVAGTDVSGADVAAGAEAAGSETVPAPPGPDEDEAVALVPADAVPAVEEPVHAAVPTSTVAAIAAAASPARVLE
jgi:hypothetical protein